MIKIFVLVEGAEGGACPGDSGPAARVWIGGGKSLAEEGDHFRLTSGYGELEWCQRFQAVILGPSGTVFRTLIAGLPWHFNCSTVPYPVTSKAKRAQEQWWPEDERIHSDLRLGVAGRSVGGRLLPS